jgi:hypothetical protein
MANEPTTIGTPGWRTLFDYSTGAGDSVRVRVRQGPALSIDGDIAALRATLDVETLDPSVSPGSAVASIRCTYRTLPSGGLALGERRSPTFAVTPSMDIVDLRAHPKVNSLSADIPVIERYIAAGDIAGLKTAYAGNANALAFAAFWVAGVSAFEAAAFQLTVTRYYTSAPSISADYAAINSVFAWSAIRTDGKAIPSYVDEPKYLRDTGAAVGFEWRLVSVAPVIERHTENVVTWIYIGREHWAKALYKGGTWEPTAL